MLNQHPRTQLCFVIQQYGQTIITEPKRCKGLLSDLAPEHRLEVNLLISALEQNVAQELLQPSALIPINIQLDRLAKRLHDVIGMNEDFAYWAVESWALALNVIQQPIPNQTTQAVAKPKAMPPPKVAAIPLPVKKQTPINLGAWVFGIGSIASFLFFIGFASTPSCIGDCTNGQGTYTYEDGDKYIGEFKNGNKHGQGTFTFSDIKYVGEWKDDVPNGQGTYTGTNGDKYVGEFKNGNKHGQGTFTYPDGTKNVGEFKDNRIDGQGTQTLPNGIEYVGEFKNGNRNGQGTLTLPDGTKYVGEFKDDEENGQGTLTRPDGTVVQSGLWKDGKPVQ